METDYNKQAIDFLQSTSTEFKVKFLKNDYHFTGDKDKRDIYKVTLKRGKIKFSFDFGQSIVGTENKEVPTAYDVLTCLQKYDVGSYGDFCSDFGYEYESETSKKIYKAVCKEYDNVCKLWNDAEVEQLQEIE